MDIATALNALLTSLPAYEQPAQSLVQKKAVRTLFAQNAVKELSHALIESIKNDRPDIFIAILANFTRAAWKPFDPREPEIIHTTLQHLIAQPELFESRRIYIMHLAARWLHVGHRHFDTHPLHQCITYHISRMLFLMLRKRTPQPDVTSSERLLFRMLSSRSAYEVDHVFSTLKKEMSSSVLTGTEFVARTAIMLSFLPYAQGFHHHDKVTAKLLAQHEKSLHLLAPAARFFISSLLHRNNPSRIDAIASDEKHILERFIPKDQLVRALRYIVSTSPLGSDTTLPGLVHLDMDAAKKALITLIRDMRAPITHLWLYHNELPEKGIYARYREEASRTLISEMPRMSTPQKIRVLAVLGTLGTEKAKTYLLDASRDSHHELSQAALIAYTDAHKVPSFRNVPYRYRDGQGKDEEEKEFKIDTLALYDIPIAKEPKQLANTFDKIPIPKNVRPLLQNFIDWNGDGYIQGSFERYRLWWYTKSLYTQIREIHDNPKYAHDHIMQRAAIALRGRLRSLMPLYAHLPQVNYQRSSVRVGSRILTLKDTRGDYRPDILFALGEAYASIPPTLRKLLWRHEKDLGQLLFSVERLDKYFWGMYFPRENHNSYFKTYRTRSIKLNTHHKWRPFASILTTFKHEFGHATDHILGHLRVAQKKCRAWWSIPIIGEAFTRRKKICQKVPYNSDILFMYRHSWNKRLQEASVSRHKVFTMHRDVENKYNSNLFHKASQLRKYFASVYGASEPAEDFATMWQTYFTELSPWSLDSERRTRADAKRLSPLHWKLFRSLDNSPDYAPPKDPD